MNRTSITAATLLALGLASAAQADHAAYIDDPSVRASASGYADREPGARYDYARVLSSEPIVRYVTVRRPVRECWQDVEYHSVDRYPRGGGAGTLVGAIVGGVIGHQFGSGRGNDAATVAGTLIGAAVGSDATRPPYRTLRRARPVERCSTRMETREERRIDGYRVIYAYDGQKFATDMPYDPGRELRVRIDIRPAG